MLVAIRCMEVALVGEKGSKVPNLALQELSLEMDFQLSISWQYDSCGSTQIFPIYACIGCVRGV